MGEKYADPRADPWHPEAPWCKQSGMEKTKHIYHICERQAWQEAARKGVYTGSAMDKADGFIHASTATQAMESAELHFAGREGLVLLIIDARRVRGDVRWEPVAARGGDAFPHIYGEIPVEAIEGVEPLDLDGEGNLLFPFLRED